MSKLALLFIALAIGQTSAREGKLKIATVDMQRLFKDYHRSNESQKEINVERARIQKENNDRMSRIREIDTGLQKLRKNLEDPAIAESKKQGMLTEWNTAQQEGTALDRERREYVERRTRLLNERMVQRMKGILEEIRKRVEEHAKAEDLDYVFDRAGLSTSQVPFFLYTREANDITGLLLEALNQEAPGAADEAREKAATDLEKAD